MVTVSKWLMRLCALFIWVSIAFSLAILKGHIHAWESFSLVIPLSTAAGFGTVLFVVSFSLGRGKTKPLTQPARHEYQPGRVQRLAAEKLCNWVPMCRQLRVEGSRYCAYHRQVLEENKNL